MTFRVKSRHHLKNLFKLRLRRALQPERQRELRNWISSLVYMMSEEEQVALLMYIHATEERVDGLVLEALSNDRITNLEYFQKLTFKDTD
jgi:hypothetical protein